MMGPITGSADNISELKKLLELVSDPKKSLDVLTKMDAAIVEGKRLSAEKLALDASASAKLKTADETLVKVLSKSTELATKTQDLVHRESALASALNIHEAQKKKLKQDIADHQMDRDIFKKWAASYEADVAKEKAQAAKTQAEADAAKAEYDDKVLKLKQITG